MAYFDVCPACGAHLDPGEPCDCRLEQERQSEFYAQRIRANPVTGQYSLLLDGREMKYDTQTAAQI